MNNNSDNSVLGGLGIKVVVDIPGKNYVYIALALIAPIVVLALLKSFSKK